MLQFWGENVLGGSSNGMTREWNAVWQFIRRERVYKRIYVGYTRMKRSCDRVLP